jgi:hypothetical protein
MSTPLRPREEPHDPASTPLLKLNNGVEMPALRLGVYRSSFEEAVDAVAVAAESGFLGEQRAGHACCALGPGTIREVSERWRVV